MSRASILRLLLVALTLAVYWQATQYGFIEFDDPDYARDNPPVKAGLNSAAVYWAFTTGHTNNWIPLTWISLMADTDFYGVLRPVLSRVIAYTDGPPALCPGGYHLTNIVLHIANVLLLFEVLRIMTRSRGAAASDEVWPSAFAAGLLALHPLHVESVAWITERKDVLSLLFWLLTMWAYLRYVREGGWREYCLVLLFMACSLMAKPMAVTMPFVLLLLDIWPLGRIDRQSNFGRLVLEKLPLLALAAAASVVTYRVQIGAEHPAELIPIALPARLANATVCYVLYLGKMFWPHDLAILYPNHAMLGQQMWTANQVAMAAACLAIITLLAALLRKSRPYLLTGWLWFLGTLVPVSGIVQVGAQCMADRYAYIPFIGLYMAIAWTCRDLAAQRRGSRILIITAAALALAACAAVTFQQVHYWRDSETLFNHAVQVTHGNWLIHNNLAITLENHQRFAEAREHLLQAVEINPNSAWLHDHLGASYAMQEQWPEAQEQFEKSIQLNPKSDRTHFNLAMLLSQRGKPYEALKHFQAAFALGERPGGRNDFARWLAVGGDAEGALAELARCRAAAPSLAQQVDELMGKIDAAAAERR